MSDLDLYWAEEALGEPYPPQDYRWMKSSRRGGLLLGGAACIMTASTFLGSAADLTMDRTPHVSISLYEIQSDAHRELQPPRSAPAAAARAETQIGSRTSPHTSVPKEVITKATLAPALAPTPARAEVKTQAARPVKPAQPPAAALAQAKPAPQAAVAASSPGAVKPESETSVGISKSADSKPTDIASGEKLGIREILSDGIVMQNGRKVRSGSALPNGEILMGTDVGKGIAETDRRVLVLTQ